MKNNTMTQEQLEKEGIKVGDYYVVRRGKRIAIMNPGTVRWGGAEDPSVELALTEKQAEHLLGAKKRLLDAENAKEAKRDRIDALQVEIAKRENEIYDLENELDASPCEDFKGYDIELPISEDGIVFGCTHVTDDDLKAISMLVKKGGKK